MVRELKKGELYTMTELVEMGLEFNPNHSKFRIYRDGNYTYIFKLNGGQFLELKEVLQFNRWHR